MRRQEIGANAPSRRVVTQRRESGAHGRGQRVIYDKISESFDFVPTQITDG